MKISIRKIDCLSLLSLISVILVLLLSGCEGKGEKGQSEKVVGDRALQRVVAVGSQWYGHIPVWIGIERGIFKNHGFDLTWRFIGKSMDRLNAIASGDAQFASLGEIAMLSAMAYGNRRFYWVGNQDIAPGFEGIVARPGINSFGDLKGKRVGFPFGSSADITCRLLLKQNGLDPEKDVNLVNLEVGDVPAVFRGGNVDAAIVWEPGFSQLKELKGATVLGMDTDTEVYKEFGTMTGPDVLVISREWVDADIERARQFMKAYFESLKWVKENRNMVVSIVQGRYIQQESGLIRKNLERFRWYDAREQKKVMSEDGIFGQAGHVVDILLNQIKAIPKRPDFRKWVNMEIVFN